MRIDHFESIFSTEINTILNFSETLEITMKSAINDEYEIYEESEFNAVEVANKLLLETNYPQDTKLDLETSNKKLGFCSSDLNIKIENLVKSNTKPFIDEVDQVEKSKDEVTSVKPSMEQLKLSYDRLDNEIVKPYNECVKLQDALKKLNQTNKILRNLSYIMYIINKIEEIDKSENSLNSKPLRKLSELCSLLADFTEFSKTVELKSIKIVRDYIDFTKILSKNCENIVNIQIKNLTKDLPSEKHVKNLISSVNSLTKMGVFKSEKLEKVKSQVFSECLKSSISIILKNLNSTKNLPTYIRNLDKSVKLLVQIGCSADEFWKELAVGIEPGVKETVNRGGPIVKNLKLIKNDLETEIKDVVGKTSGKLETTMMINSLTNFEKRR